MDHRSLVFIDTEGVSNRTHWVCFFGVTFWSEPILIDKATHDGT